MTYRITTTHKGIPRNEWTREDWAQALADVINYQFANPGVDVVVESSDDWADSPWGGLSDEEYKDLERENII